MKNIELIIFDLDGTLVNSQFDLADAVNYALKNMGRPLIEYEQVPDMVGSGVRKLLELALGDFTDIELGEARKLFDLYYSKNYTNKTACYSGVPETLRYFNKKKKAVYSNKIHAYTVEIISGLGLSQYFDIIMGARPELYLPKPSPEGVLYILNKLNIQPENAIMVGDSTHDIHAAQAAGLRTCAVSYGYRPLPVLEKAKPDFLIDRMEELKDWLG
ncbi:MAG TPA: HAD family hydrolase [Bacteroidetes bacterium]|nr:HAD family hydrolase [Bacteroidota bacterium]